MQPSQLYCCGREGHGSGKLGLLRGGAALTVECILKSLTLNWNGSLMLDFFFHRRQREIFLGKFTKVYFFFFLLKNVFCCISTKRKYSAFHRRSIY